MLNHIMKKAVQINIFHTAPKAKKIRNLNISVKREYIPPENMKQAGIFPRENILYVQMVCPREKIFIWAFMQAVPVQMKVRFPEAGIREILLQFWKKDSLLKYRTE